LPGRFAVRAESRRSRLYHRDAIAQRVTAAIADALGAGPEPGDQPVVLARFLDDTCTLSLDTTGPALHDRGYRQEPGPAPLREDIARALVLASGWDRRRPLIDPFAGAGTIAIEAALLARGQAPGRHRKFAFHATRLYDAARFAALQAEADAAVRPGARILASDRRADCIAMTERNAERAGVRADLEVAAAPLSSSPWRAELAHAGAVVSDPPHGKRLGDPRALVKLYRALGAWLAGAPADCAIALVAADRRLALRTGLPLKTAFLTPHGGRKVRALVRPLSGGAAAPA
ncbi:MAG TPA: class I SAM-dependent RNA methyltransferase, partial [Planctomycetota bacterium]|nr:class I SAM-dependent RNA methyltransferase [Planctomycetota bacterium]